MYILCALARASGADRASGSSIVWHHRTTLRCSASCTGPKFLFPRLWYGGGWENGSFQFLTCPSSIHGVSDVWRALCLVPGFALDRRPGEHRSTHLLPQEKGLWLYNSMVYDAAPGLIPLYDHVTHDSTDFCFPANTHCPLPLPLPRPLSLPLPLRFHPSWNHARNRRVAYCRWEPDPCIVLLSLVY